MTPRPSLSRKRRAEIYRDADGICHICGRRIAFGEAWQAEHPHARALGGSDDPRELRPAHVDCHAGKTKRDRKLIAHNDGAMVKNTPGLRKPSRPIGRRGVARIRQLDEERT